MTKPTKIQPDPAYIEIDVVGYRIGFNRLSAGVNESDIKYTVRDLNVAQIATLDVYNPLLANKDFRSARSRITMTTDEILYSPRTVDEIKGLSAAALDSPSRAATCFYKKPPELNESTSAADFNRFAQYKSPGEGLRSPSVLETIYPADMAKQFVSRDL